MLKQLLGKTLFTTCLFASAIGISVYAQTGYALYSVQGSNSTQLIEASNVGTTYKSWTHSNAPTAYSSFLMPGGILWRSVSVQNNLNNGGGTGRIQKVDANGTVLWDFTYSSSTYYLHHDFCPMPNGNVLLISYDVRSGSEAQAAGATSSSQRNSEKIMEVDPKTSQIVWEWKLWDHLVQNKDANKANYQSSIVNHPELLDINYKATTDWLHMNGIDYNPILDQIAVSSHNLNMWFVIDHSTTTAEAASHSGGNSGKGGDILYRYGNPASYGASGSTALNVTHDAHWIQEFVPDAGRLTGFNNGGTGSKSTVDQIDVPLNGYNYDITLGQAYLPASYTSRIVCNGSSSNMGSSDELPSGNSLICVATAGRIYECDASGTAVWTKTVSGIVPQAHYYSKCFVDKPAPAIPTITSNGGVLTSSAATQYQWYLNGKQISGATSASYTPTEKGVYMVRITDTNACVYQYSKGSKITVISGINELSESNGYSIFPNPSNGIVYIKDVNNSGRNFEVFVLSAIGKVVLHNKTLYQFDLSEYGNGVYTVVIRSEDGNTKQTKIVVTK